MDLIIAILMFLNLLAPGETPTTELISENQATIDQYKSDPVFMNQYHKSDGIAIFDLEGGD